MDTGAIYTVVDRVLLESIGLKPVERRKFRAFGGDVERDIGVAEIELMGRRGGITIILVKKRIWQSWELLLLRRLGLKWIR